MGIAASSALRAESAVNGPAYGSLEALGGPRKFKKKPVLVLDPEELEKAHAMFHEASAELLGEDVERAPRPVGILGLAPMVDDDPEEMGAADDVEDGAEDDMPTPEAVLALTRRKTPPPEDNFIDDSSLDGLGSMSAGMIDPVAGGSIDDDIDLENRIFPSLPVQPELAEDSESAPPAAPIEQELPEPVLEVQTEVDFKPEPEFVAEPEQEPEPAPATATEDRPVATEPAPLEPEQSEPDAASSAHSPAQRTPLSTRFAAFDSWKTNLRTGPINIDPATDLPFVSGAKSEPVAETEPQSQLDWSAPEQVPPAEESLLPDLPPAPEPEPDLPPEPAFEQPREDAAAPQPDELGDAVWDEFDADAIYDVEGAAEKVAESGTDIEDVFSEDVVSDYEHDSSDHENLAAADAVDDGDLVDDDGFTLTDDDNVDGYAFMRDPRSRRSAVLGAQQGRQSALRAKLIREAAEDAAQAERDENSGSMFAAAWNWIRGLFSRRD